MAAEDDFVVDISKWVEKAKAKSAEFVPAFALAMQKAIQEATPVLTGRLRNSIQPTTPISDFKPGDSIEIGTNVEYARRL